MTPLQTEFYGRIGKTLLEVQLAEQLLQNCLSYFLRAGEAKTVEEIETMAAADRKKSLGKLIEKIRERIVVQKGFDDKLTKFVEDRNALAHRFLKVDGVSLHTDEGLKALNLPRASAPRRMTCARLSMVSCARLTTLQKATTKRKRIRNWQR